MMNNGVCRQAKILVSTVGSKGCIAIVRKEIMRQNPFAKIKNSKYHSPRIMSSPPLLIEYDSSNRDYDIIQCSAWPLHPLEIVDTTGSGDSFIGGCLFGLLNEFSVEVAIYYSLNLVKFNLVST